MKKVYVLSAALLLLAVFSAAALAEGPVKVSSITTAETHTKIGKKVSGTSYSYSGETFIYEMISVTRELQKGYIGGVFVMTRYGVDDRELNSFISGINLTRIMSPTWIGTIGYTHSTDPEQYILGAVPSVDSDRFSANLIYNFNPKEKKGAKYSLTTGFSSVTDFGEQQVVSEKVQMNSPLWGGKKWNGELAYTYSYSAQQSDQLTNMFSGKLTYGWNKEQKTALNVMYIDNTYENNQGDDTVVRLIHTVNLR